MLKIPYFSHLLVSLFKVNSCFFSHFSSLLNLFIVLFQLLSMCIFTHRPPVIRLKNNYFPFIFKKYAFLINICFYVVNLFIYFLWNVAYVLFNYIKLMCFSVFIFFVLNLNDCVTGCGRLADVFSEKFLYMKKSFGVHIHFNLWLNFNEKLQISLKLTNI